MTAASIDVRQNGGGRREVLCAVRRRWVALTPEEEVRQRTILLLHTRYDYPLELMQVEGTIMLNGLSRRCDIVVYSTDGRPRMIVECKEPNVKITQKVCDQACRYNMTLQVPYILLTNWHNIIVIGVDFAARKLTVLNDIPDFSAIEMLNNEQKQWS